jgi:hypothetical protein
MKLVPKTTTKRRIIELWDYDFKWIRALERARLEGVPDIPAVKVFDALMESRISDPTTIRDIMRALSCPCDDDGDDERCRVIRVVEVDDRGWIVDDHPSEG